MNRKGTELSISDKWSLDEQLGAALRDLESKKIRQEITFEQELLTLMERYNMSRLAVIKLCEVIG